MRRTLGAALYDARLQLRIHREYVRDYQQTLGMRLEKKMRQDTQRWLAQHQVQVERYTTRVNELRDLLEKMGVKDA